jgi:outer membrane receptor protein involved in Fe transport
MKKIHYCLLSLIILTTTLLNAQTGIIQGKALNAITNEALPFVTVGIQGTTTGVATDINGEFKLENLQPGTYNLDASLVGYKKKTLFDVSVNNAKPTYIEITMEESATDLKTVEVTTSPFSKTEESPVSLRNIGAEEIKRLPGANRDISKVIQSLPGVASTPAFRNDIIIRGGAPNENRFYLDGIEVPNINHFATQGSSGGPVGLINVNLINDVDFYSGAFPANRGNALSSVFEFKQKDGRSDKWVFTGAVGNTDFGLTADGPISKNSSLLVSVRRSYLQGLFSILGLPFLPTYNDYQVKYKIKFSDKADLTIVSLGALDQFELNTGIANPDEEQRYILENIPTNNQWNYTIGANLRLFAKKGYKNIVISRNMLRNSAIKYKLNVETDANRILDYNSDEIENKFRFESTSRQGNYKFNYGVSYQFSKYKVNTYQVIATQYNPNLVVDFSSNLNFHSYAAFGQVSRTFLASRLSLSAGVRADGNSYSTQMANPLKQVSPRLSASYSLTERWALNANAGMYYQLPSYTVLGYRNQLGSLVNKDNGVKYINGNHLVAGIEYKAGNSAKITVEGFYKTYNNYPFSIKDSVSLANQGADFGVIGNTAVIPASKGRSYGVELLAQQKITKGFYGILSATYVRSEFTDKSNEYKPSAWDNRFLFSLTAGKNFKRGWVAGVRFRWVGGAPYTPTDTTASLIQAAWDVNNQGILDISQLNSQRLSSFNQLDIRVDKLWYFKKWTLNLYLDIQNLLNYKAQQAPRLTPKQDANGNKLTYVDGNNVTRYVANSIPNTAGIVLPTIGLIVEF